MSAGQYLSCLLYTSYRLFAIDATDTASIMCFAGVRFMLSALLVYAGGAALRRGPLQMCIRDSHKFYNKNAILTFSKDRSGFSNYFAVSTV